jgi:hypothetical protein
MDPESQEAYEVWISEPGIGAAYAGDPDVKEGFMAGYEAKTRAVKEEAVTSYLNDVSFEV